MEKNKAMHAKLKNKDETKAKLRREAKEAVADVSYWENRHAKLQEEFEGK